MRSIAALLCAVFALAAFAAKLPAPRSLSPSVDPDTRAEIQTEFRCFNKTRRAIFGITPDVMCPCLVRFKLTRRRGTSSPKGKSVDFLIVTSKEAAKLRQAAPSSGDVAFVKRYSMLGAKTIPAADNRFAYSSPSFEIAKNEPFALVIRYSAPRADCDIGVSYVLEQTPRKCPQRLAPPPVLPPSPPLFTLQGPPAPRVVGGDSASDSVRRLMVSIVRSGSLVCSGSLIAPGWVLTAAHCRVRASSDEAYVLGEDGFAGERRRVEDDVPHPDFDASTNNGPHDIALFRLVGPPVPGARPVAINARSEVPAAFSYVRIAGYGRIFEGFQTTSAPALRTVDIPVRPKEQCEEAYDVSRVNIPYPLDSDTQLCAGYDDEGECDACQGDSGGPALGYENDGEPVQVAIVSYGMGCARGHTPGVYTRIAPYVEWIRSITNDVVVSQNVVEVLADSLNSDVSDESPPSGLGVDGMGTPISTNRHRGTDVKGEDERSVRLLRFVLPSAIAGFSGLLLSCACIVGCCASTRRDKLTQSDHATGMHTASIQGPQSEFGIASTSLADSDGIDPLGGPSFMFDSDQSSDTLPLEIVTAPSATKPKSVSKPPVVRRLFGRRQRPEEIIRMPEDMISAGGGADTFEDDPIVEVQPAPRTPKRVRIVDMTVGAPQEALGNPYSTSPKNGDLRAPPINDKRNSRRSIKTDSPGKHKMEMPPSVVLDDSAFATLRRADSAYSTSPLDGDLQVLPESDKRNIKHSSKRNSKRISVSKNDVEAPPTTLPISGRADMDKRRRSRSPEDNVGAPSRVSLSRETPRRLGGDSLDQPSTAKRSSKRNSKRASSSGREQPPSALPVGGIAEKDERRRSRNVDFEARHDRNSAIPGRDSHSLEIARAGDSVDQPNVGKRSSKRNSKRGSSNKRDTETPASGARTIEGRRRSRQEVAEQVARDMANAEQSAAALGILVVPSLDEVVPERTTSRPILQFHEDLVHGFVDR